jgi:hypothetical protein
MDRIENKRALKAFLPSARRIVNKVDPLDLIKMGAPKDEYDDLVNEAARWLARGATDLDVRLAQFVRAHYQLSPNRETMVKLATELRRAWQSAR